VINVDHRGNINLPSEEELVAAVVSASRKSQRLLQQLYSLEDYSAPSSLDVPAIDLFKTEGQMSLSKTGADETRNQLDLRETDSKYKAKNGRMTSVS